MQTTTLLLVVFACQETALSDLKLKLTVEEGGGCVEGGV